LKKLGVKPNNKKTFSQTHYSKRCKMSEEQIGKFALDVSR